MKKHVLLCLCMAMIQTMYGQSYQVNVNSGYGSGSFNEGDTVWIFARPPAIGEIFDKWDDPKQVLNFGDEWNEFFEMPASDVTLSAQFKSMPAVILKDEKIQGKDILKQVYSAFPSSMKGVIWIFHGTGGKASNWINSFESRNFVNYAIGNEFGVIISESEESSLNMDLNGDDKIRWQVFPADTSSNIDYLNLAAIRDTFILRGNISWNTAQYAMGMSNGGAMAFTFGALKQLNAIVSYCASGAQATTLITQTPSQWCMCGNDQNENVGEDGNQQALDQSNYLIANGVDSRYYIHYRTSLYAERFARTGMVSEAKSVQLATEIFDNMILDGKNRFNFNADSFSKVISASPAKWPVFLSLSNGQKLNAGAQIDIMYGDHQFYSDFNARTIEWFEMHLGATSIEEGFSQQETVLFPNPVTKALFIKHATTIWNSYEIFDGSQILRMKGQVNQQLELENLVPGIYFIKLFNAHGDYEIHKFVKL